MLKKETIVVVGMACRFPDDAVNQARFWDFLKSERDAISDVTEDRWSKGYYFRPTPKAKWKTHVISAGQLDNAYQFESDFFWVNTKTSGSNGFATALISGTGLGILGTSRALN